jgi:dolichol-phosphate mannosyltransferase
MDEIRILGYVFQIEMKYTEIKHGFKVIGIYYFTDKTERTSKMKNKITREAFLAAI